MKKTILTALTLFFTSISISTYAEEFTDIDQTNFSYEILESLSKKYNFAFDYPDFKFNGSKTVNRYELNYMVKEEERKRQICKEENERRQHNYIPLIYEILESLSKNDNLEEIYNQALKEENQNNMNKTKKEV